MIAIKIKGVPKMQRQHNRFWNPCRLGITLLELLVVLACIVMLVSMLLPAVQRTRETTRQVSCKNKLRQIGIAAIAFESKFGYFPSNGWGYLWGADPTRGYGAEQPGGWIYNLSGELEIVTGGTATTGGQMESLRELNSVVSAHLHCPTRGRPELSPHSTRFSPVNYARPDRVGKTDYAINEGSKAFPYLPGPASLEEAKNGEYVW